MDDSDVVNIKVFGIVGGAVDAGLGDQVGKEFGVVGDF